MRRVIIHLDIPENYYDKAKYIFSMYSMAWGIPIQLSKNKSLFKKAHIVYTKRTHSMQFNGKIVIPFDEALYEKHTKCDVIIKDGYHLWVKSSEKNNIDLIASTYRLLAFSDECQIRKTERNKSGIFSVNSLPENRKKIIKLPIVEDHIAFIIEKLLINIPSIKNSIIPRWPNNKKYVISITHDTDAVNLGSPKELLTNSLKYFLRFDRVYLNMFKDGLKYIYNPNENPFFSYSDWRAYEAQNNLKSCFYLYVKPQKTPVHINDCKSDLLNEKIDWEILKLLANEDWEIGLHPSINAKQNIDEFIYSKKLLEDKIEIDVFGLRHHYWALDWFKPYLTFRKHVNAGFKYDSSIAWRDAPGFRAGTCLPFRPFDPIRNKPLNMYELPTCLMDGHIINNNGNTTEMANKGIKIIESVKERNGVAVLDWHTESYCNDYVYSSYMEVFHNILNHVIGDNDLWVATPLEIINWWNHRSIDLIKNSNED